jgi:hypothetical protein
MDNPKKLKGASKYVGVSPHHGRWTANTYRGDKKIYIGIYDTEEEAALAYNAKVVELFGSKARLNKIG